MKTLPLMNSENCESLLLNPDRGLRMETYITLGDPLEAYPTGGEEPFERTQALIDKYRSDSPTLCQVYVYLCNYNKKPLDSLAFDQMKRFFELFRDNNIRMLLRFVYATEAVSDAPYRRVKKHLAQIKEWFGENEELINDTLYCLQTGIIGWWGEGHTYKKLKGRHLSKVISDVCALAPEGIYSQIRTYDLLGRVKPDVLPMMGIHDDYIIGDITHMWSFIPKAEGTINEFNKTMAHASLTVNDGEMPWGGSTLNDSADGASLNTLDGRAVLNQLKTYSLTSFSLEHNYRETRIDMAYAGPYSLGIWQNEYLAFDEAEALGLSPNPSLFKNSAGEDAPMSIYNIIRYHLGYQLALSGYESADGKTSFSVKNFGFAPPLCFNYLALVSRNTETGELAETPISSYKKEELLSGAEVIYTADVPEGFEAVGVKLATQKGRRQTVRFANDTKYENGVQYFNE